MNLYCKIEIDIEADAISPDVAIEAWRAFSQLRAPVIEVEGILYEVDTATNTARFFDPTDPDREVWA